MDTTLNRILIALLVLTAILMTWHEFGMNRSFTLERNNFQTIIAVSDRDVGGLSQARMQRDGETLQMNCVIQKAFAWPFCQINFIIADPRHGFDFTQYATLHLNMNITGPGNPGIRVHLRNHDPEYASVWDHNSLRVNQIEFRPSQTGTVLEVPLSQFEVAQWWQEQYKIPFNDARARLDNVVRIEVMTGSQVEDGEYQLTIHDMTFSGKWFPRDHLYFGILMAWVVAAFVFLTRKVISSRREARETRARHQELEVVCQALEQRSSEYREQAQRDALTGALNRAGLRDILHEKLPEVRSGKVALSLIAMDIDHFKRINDTYGHGVGDDVLQLFSRRIIESTRSIDHLARWGGEEFLLVCSGANLDEATHLAEKLRKMLFESEWPHHGALSCSMGVGELRNENIAVLLERVDQALYRAKRNGRNRVEISDGMQELDGQPSIGKGIELALN
jgi:diguanylate cyclase (GGDEF)-like protein